MTLRTRHSKSLKDEYCYQNVSAYYINTFSRDYYGRPM